MARTSNSDTENKAEDQKLDVEEAPKLAQAVPGTDPSNVEMVKVRTTGDFMFLDPYSGYEILPDQSNEVPNTAFVKNKLAEEQLKKG